MSFSQEVIRQWMKGVLAEKEWSNREWARRAQVGPSTISRFLAEKDAKWTPSTTTIDKLAAAAGSSPGDYIGRSVASRNVSLVFVPVMIVTEHKELILMKPATSVPVTRATGGGSFAIPCDQSVGQAGIKEGDFLVVDPDAQMGHDQWVACVVRGKVHPIMRWQIEGGNAPGVQWMDFSGMSPKTVEPERILGVIVELNRRF